MFPSKAKAKNLRVGQRLVRLQWRSGQPYIEVARVVSISSRGGAYRLKTARGEEMGHRPSWYECWQDAVENEIIEYCQVFDWRYLLWLRQQENVTPWNVALVICKIVRLARRIAEHTEGLK